MKQKSMNLGSVLGRHEIKVVKGGGHSLKDTTCSADSQCAVVCAGYPVCSSLPPRSCNACYSCTDNACYIWCNCPAKCPDAYACGT
ncbi:MAG: hypothetical protein QM528_01230 [Phycisphaerales bacterium]|nr:hypothetical protein [Phycisphaerales bacterium]